jgi:hypothetical protein
VGSSRCRCRAGQDRVERCGELAGAIADEESEGGGVVIAGWSRLRSDGWSSGGYGRSGCRLPPTIKDNSSCTSLTNARGIDLLAARSIRRSTYSEAVSVRARLVWRHPDHGPGRGLHICRTGGQLLFRWARISFAMQTQQQTQWCWAAVAVSVARYYTPWTGWTQWSSSREGSHLPALADLGVTVSRYPALVILSARRCGPIASGGRAWGTGW